MAFRNTRTIEHTNEGKRGETLKNARMFERFANKLKQDALLLARYGHVQPNLGRSVIVDT